MSSSDTLACRPGSVLVLFVDAPVGAGAGSGDDRGQMATISAITTIRAASVHRADVDKAKRDRSVVRASPGSGESDID
jgi:hypothetical protein